MEVNSKSKTGKLTNMWKYTHYKITNGPHKKKKSQEKFKNMLRQIKKKSQHTKRYERVQQKQC